MNFPPIYQGSLKPETAATLIERELARFLCLPYQGRLLDATTKADVPTVDALRQYKRKGIFDYALRFVVSIGKTFRFDQYETRPDNGITIIKPLDSTGDGAWVLEGATEEQRTSNHIGVRDAAIRLDKWARLRSGFIKIVRLYEGEYDEEALAEVFALKPAYVVVPYVQTAEAKTLIPGTYYKETYKFRIWGISQNLRRGPAGILGSTSETKDPGLNYVMGAARRALAGSTLGMRGICSVELGDEAVVAHDLANRVFCNALDIFVTATIHMPDDDIVPLTGVTITHELVGQDEGGDVDLANYVATGCGPPRAGALHAEIAAGIAYIKGSLVSSIPLVVDFPPSSDTYRDLLPSGAFVVQSVANDALPPNVAPGALRVGVTVTDASAITSDRFLCSTWMQLVGPDRIPKES